MDESDIKVNMTPSHPGYFIRTEVLEELGVGIEQAAAMLDVPQQALTEVLDGAAVISHDMAQHFEKAFGVSGEMLLQMQAWHNHSKLIRVK